jgi:hypothetical protein
MGHITHSSWGEAMTLRSRSLAGTLVALVVMLAVAAVAWAAVSVDKAELRSGSLVVEGRGAVPNATVTATSPESTASSRAGSDGRFKIQASSYRSSTCKATVSDGSTSTTATLSGCTVSSPTPPPSGSNVITPDVAEIGPGFVGADFTSNSTTTSTLTFGPNAIGPVRWQIIAGALPNGLSLVNAFPSITPAKQIHGAIQGTPTTVQVSTFTVRATDANGQTATRTYTIRINPAKTLAIEPEQWAPLTVGSFGNLWIDGLGGVKPYRWAVTAGQLPPGMSLIQDNPDGPLVRVGGTPTTAGTFTWTLRLTDAQASTVSRTLSVTVSG